MALQLLFNGGLAVFFTYCFFYVGSVAPEPLPGNMDGAQWPQIILALLVFFILINMYNIYKKTPKEERNTGSITNINYKGFFKNKLVLGIAGLLIYAFTLEYIGFLVGSFLFGMYYSWLLGEKRIKRLVIYSFLIVAILYILFTRGLDVMLPRGVGPLRDFALFLESF